MLPPDDAQDPKLAALGDLKKFLKDRQMSRLGKLGKPADDGPAVDDGGSSEDGGDPDHPKPEGVGKAGELKGDASEDTKEVHVEGEPKPVVSVDGKDAPAADDMDADSDAGAEESPEAEKAELGVDAKGEEAPEPNEKVKQALVLLKHLKRR